MSCFISCEASVTKNIQAASEGPIWDDLRQDLYRVQDTIRITSEEYESSEVVCKVVHFFEGKRNRVFINFSRAPSVQSDKLLSHV